jgi:hypothetical protein
MFLLAVNIIVLGLRSFSGSPFLGWCLSFDLCFFVFVNILAASLLAGLLGFWLSINFVLIFL